MSAGAGLVGAILGGKYRIQGPLGAGGMGDVFVAVQEPLERKVALKMIRGADIDQAHRDRFAREANLVAQLKCPHIVTLHDFGEHQGEPYIVMELLEGQTLRSRMTTEAVAPTDALAWTRDIACALRSAHEAGIVHRDLKPENVMLVPDRDRGTRAKLLDFGIAMLRERVDPTGATQSDVVVGTPGYIAPETILHGRGDEPGVDVYALGVVMFELLTGGPPFTGTTPIALMMAHAREPVPDLPSSDAKPAEVVALVRRLLSKDPKDRPLDGAAMVTELDRIRAGMGSAAVSLGLCATEIGPLSLPSRPSIAVSPFIALGGDEDGTFAEGISEDILTALSYFRQLFVLSIATMVQPSGRDTDPLRICRTFGVRYVLQGSVRRAGQRIRVTAKLVDGTTGAQVWAQRYDRELEDLFAVQDDVTRAIVACVAGRIEEAQAETARRKAPHVLGAYDWLARGRAHHHRRTKEDNRAARAALAKAIDLEPDYAQAYAWQACVLGQAFSLGDGQPQMIAQYAHALKRSLELDDKDSECHRLAAETALIADGPKQSDMEQAWHHHERAIALNPNDARIVGQRGELCLYRGELEQAVEALELAARLDPLAPKPYWRNLAATHYMQRRLDLALQMLRKLSEERPDLVALEAAVMSLRGDAADARRLADRARASGWGQGGPPRPFVTESLHARWREGFERAGLLA